MGVYFPGGNLVGIPFLEGVECLGEEAQPMDGDTVYVSPDGNDENSGASPDDPLGTLSKALCNVGPGQTVMIMPGTYYESIIMGVFGSSTEPIIIQGVSSEGGRPVLDGENKRTMGIALVESTNIVVENLDFRNYTDEGLLVLVGSDIVIRDNLFIDNGRASIDPDLNEEGFGLSVLGTEGVLIEGNEAARNGPGEERARKGILGMGIDTFGLQGAVIRDNYCHDNIGGGILVEDSFDVLVENNIIENNELDAAGDYWDGGIWLDGGRNVTLRGNTLTSNHGPGLQVSDEGVQFPNASTGHVIEDNTITGNVFGLYIMNYGQCPLPPEEGARFSNNRIADNTQQDIYCQAWPCGEGLPCD